MPLYLQKLQQYLALIIFWQTKFNLISNNTITNIWERHILDSLQLVKFITSNQLLQQQTIFDLGAGAGFPSVVLAILDENNTYYAIEANSKKCVFLQHIKRELQLSNFIIINMRIEDFVLQNKKANIIVSRALTSLTTLLTYSTQLLAPQGYGIFPKGSSWQQEITKISSTQQNSFNFKIYNNMFSSKGKILLCQYQD